MKIFHGTTVPDSLAFLVGLPTFLQKQGDEVAIWSSPGPGLDRFVEREGCIGYSVAMARAISPLRDLQACVRLIRLFRRTQPDIVHAHTPKAGLLGMIAARLVKVPIRIYHIHGFPFITAKGWKRWLLTTTERISARCATHVIAVGSGMRQIAIQECICSAPKVRVLHHGTASGIDAVNHFNPDRIEQGLVDALRRHIGIPPGAPVVGFVGRLARDKGVEELVAAWRLLAVWKPALRLVMVGGVDARDGIPEERIAEWMATPGIHLLGHVDDVAPLYLLFDVLALPTYGEGFGNVLLEASAMRVPVVASRIPGCSDAVIDGVTGSLVELRNVSELARVIGLYLDDPILRERHGQNGRQRVLRDFAPLDVFCSLLETYRSIRNHG